MQNHLSTCQSILSTKILFLKISFFPKFCPILFFQKKKNFRNFFTVHRYCSLLLFIVDVHSYCSRPKLQNNNCIAIQFSAPCPFLATIHHVYYNTKKKQPFKSQYNTSIVIQFFHYTPLYCNTILSPLSLLSHNTPCVLQYKKKQPFKSQYNTSIVIQFFHYTPLYCNTIFQLPSLAIHSCILQYNFHQSSSLQYNPLPTRLGHNTLIVLQYNSNSPLASLIAIQFSSP